MSSPLISSSPSALPNPASIDVTAPAKALASTAAIGLVLVAMAVFAIMDGLTKLLSQSPPNPSIMSQSVPIPQILWVRNIGFCLLVFTMFRAQGLPLRTLVQSKRTGLQIFRALLLMVESGIFMLAFKLMPLADVHAIAAMAPLVVVGLSVPMLGEKVGWRRWSAVLVGFAGVLLIVRPGFQQMQPPVLIALFGAILWALYQVLIRLCARTDRSETTTLWTAMVGLLATTLVGPVVWVWPSPLGWAFLAVITILGALGHMAMIRAFSMTEPSLLQPYNYTLFVWAVVVGYLMFGHVPDSWTWFGAAVIIASGIYVWHRERVRSQR